MAVNSNLILRQFTSDNILFSANGRLQIYPWKYLVYPSFITKVNLETSQLISDQIGAPSIQNFQLIYNKIDKDDFRMYNIITGIFTIPISGYWKVSYTTTIFAQYDAGGGPNNLGRMALHGYIKKNLNDRFALSSKELSLIHNITDGPWTSPAQEIITTENSSIILFNKGDVFSVNGRLLGLYDSVIRTNRIYALGDPSLLSTIIFNEPSVDLLNGFKILTECAVEFVRPSNFLF